MEASGMAAVEDEVARRLCELAERGQSDELKQNLSSDNCRQARSADGMTPLMCAARAAGQPYEAHRACAQQLLEMAGDREELRNLANATDRCRVSCLHHAAASDNVAVVELLLTAGSRVNSLDMWGRSALMFSVARGCLRSADLLLRCGADPLLRAGTQDKAANTPMDLAAQLGNMAMIELVDMWLPSVQIDSGFQELGRDQRKLISEKEYAKVYRVATQQNLPIVVRVLKVFIEESARRAELTGLDSLKQARHRNVVQLIRCDYSGPEAEIFLEQVDGKTLKQLLDAGPFVETKVKQYTRQIANALSYLHNHPNGAIIHRDIKCNNIIVTPSEVVKLVDLGFARPLVDDRSFIRSTTELGTFTYMAPEIIGSENQPEYSSYSDIWAFGCTLYNMAMGKLPFEGCTGFIIRRIMTEGAPRLDPEKKLSRELHSLYNSCVERRPHDRISAACIVLHEYLRVDSSLGLPGQSRQEESDILNELHASAKMQLVKWGNDAEKMIGALQFIADKINKLEKQTTGGKVAGTAVAVAGGIVTIVGCALLIPSFGAALPLVIVGASVATAGGAGAAASDISKRLLQSKSFTAATEKVGLFKAETDRLFLDLVFGICRSVQREVRKCAYCTASRSVDFDKVERRMRKLAARLSNMSQSLVVKLNLPDNEAACVNKMFDSWLTPIGNALELIKATRPVLTGSRTSDFLPDKFSGKFGAVVKLFKHMVQILLFDSREVPSDPSYYEPIKTGIRAAAGGAHIGAEAAGAVGRAVLPKALGIAGAAIFTVVDIAFLAYYSKQLHDALQGKNAPLAEQIQAQRRSFMIQRDQMVALAKD